MGFTEVRPYFASQLLLSLKFCNKLTFLHIEKEHGFICFKIPKKTDTSTNICFRKCSGMFPPYNAVSACISLLNL